MEEKECPVCPPEEKLRLLKMSEISLSLDTYDDIFSDFDPRPYSERALSDDFLYEAKRASREKRSGKVELHFLIPQNARNHESEKIIAKRLHEHFKKHHMLIHKETNDIRSRGTISALIGMILMAVATYISTMKSEDFLFNLLFVMMEPAGWFITWFGLDNIFYTSTQRKPDLEFYEKMSTCEIRFTPY